MRTAMTAVYRMTHLDRPVDPLFEGQYDIRMVKAGMLTMTGKEKIELSDLPKINPLKLQSAPSVSWWMPSTPSRKFLPHTANAGKTGN